MKPHASGSLYLLLGTLFVSLCSSPPAAAATSIDHCPYTINSPGFYIVTRPLSCTGTAITIQASNVTLSLGSYTLTGNGSGSAIVANSRSGLTIQIGRITGFLRGIDLTGCTSCMVQGVIITNSGGSGISLDTCDHSTIQSNVANNNGASGISLLQCSYNTIRGNQTNTNVSSGINVVDSSHNFFQGNQATGAINHIDLYDNSPNCGSNVWQNNRFGTANQMCIH